VSFFEPPPPPLEEPVDPGQPEWAGPPDNVVGTPLAVRVILARTADIAVAVTNASVFATGMTLTLSVRARTMSEELHRMAMSGGPFHHRPHRAGRTDGNEIPTEVLRFGLQFADGRKATSVGGGHWGSHAEPTPLAPALIPMGGTGRDRSWETSYWLWPLPPPGPLALVVEWPAAGIPLTRTEIDTSPIVAAAAEAEELWPAERAADSPVAGFLGSSSQMALGCTGYAPLHDEPPVDEPADEPTAGD
jgi:hypothetical protein